MRFQILDLILTTAFIAGLLSAYSTDLFFFRQMLFLGCTTFFSSLGCLWFSKNRTPIPLGAFGGTVGGLAFTLIALATLTTTVSFYAPDRGVLGVARLTEYAAVELFLAPFFGLFLGAAIGPLVHFYLTSKVSPATRIPHTLSWCLLGAACLLAFFSMRDRLEFGVPTRKWIYGVPLVLAIFTAHTIQWIKREHGSPIVEEEIETTAEKRPGDV